MCVCACGYMCGRIICFLPFSPDGLTSALRSPILLSFFSTFDFASVCVCVIAFAPLPPSLPLSCRPPAFARIGEMEGKKKKWHSHKRKKRAEKKTLNRPHPLFCQGRWAWARGASCGPARPSTTRTEYDLHLFFSFSQVSYLTNHQTRSRTSQCRKNKRREREGRGKQVKTKDQCE